jgi:mono/diheme cytochrome c family protein
MASNNDEYNKGGFNAFLFSMSFVFIFIFYLIVIHPGIALDEKVVDPNKEAEVGETPKFDIQKIAEPWVENPEVVAYGQKVFMTNCAMCHGNEGKGDGPAGAGLNPKPRNLVEGKWKMGGGPIAHYKVLLDGIAGGSMASYKHFKSADRWALVQYIESITEAKGTDTPEQIAEYAKTAK